MLLLQPDLGFPRRAHGQAAKDPCLTPDLGLDAVEYLGKPCGYWAMKAGWLWCWVTSFLSPASFRPRAKMAPLRSLENQNSCSVNTQQGSGSLSGRPYPSDISIVYVSSFRPKDIILSSSLVTSFLLVLFINREPYASISTSRPFSVCCPRTVLSLLYAYRSLIPFSGINL